MVDATKNEWLARANGIKHTINRKSNESGAKYKPSRTFKYNGPGTRILWSSTRIFWTT